MNSPDLEPGIESELIDLEAVSFTKLREWDDEALRRSMRHVVERASRVRARYKSSGAGGGERID